MGFQLRDGFSIEVLIVRMNHHENHMDVRMFQKRVERSGEDCPAAKRPILLWQAASGPKTAAGSDDEGGD